MRYSAPSPFIAATVMATQLLGPAVLWAAEQRGIRVEANRQIVVSALSGNQLAVQGEQGATALQFRDPVPEDARITTGAGTTAELLIGNRAVVTLGNGTTAQVRTVSSDQTTIQVTKGTVRVAAAASAVGPQGLVTVQTPTSQVQTRGGIVRVLVDTPLEKAEQPPTGAQAYRASYTLLLAAANPPNDIIHVEEGTAEIPGVGPTRGVLTVKAGQRVTVQAGRAGSVAETVTPGAAVTGILATTGHTLTPKEGRDYLVALQVDQATKLGQALTGAAETSPGDSNQKSDTKNTINGATGGVNLPGGGNSGNNNLVSILFGNGNTANPSATLPQDRQGPGFGGNNNAGGGGFLSSLACDNPANCNVSTKGNGGNTLLVFTRKDPVEPFVKKDTPSPGSENTLREAFVNERVDDGQQRVRYESVDGRDVQFFQNRPCPELCLASHYFPIQEKDPEDPDFTVEFDSSRLPRIPENVGFRPIGSILSKFTVAKELVLIGGEQNAAHRGEQPTERLIVRGAGSSSPSFTNLARTDEVDGLFPTDRDPANIGLFAPTPQEIVAANSTFVVVTPSRRLQGGDYVGGTLGQFSNDPRPSVDARVAEDEGEEDDSHIDGAITATGSDVLLKGGVILDQETTATIGTTPNTNSYFADLSTDLGRTFSGSLLSVIRGPQNTPTMLTMQDRMLGVYDGSTINTNGGNKALLSVLDAKLKGPGSSIPLIDIAAGTHFDRDGNATPGKQPNVTVTSALVTRSTLPLDGALLEASAPLFALTQATMTTTNHFADLAGNQAQSLKLGDALVALNASKLIINSGHLLNLNNATAAISGYLFSLSSGSQLDIKNGTLFSLNNNSSLTLNGNAFGAFGGGSNTVTIENNLCTGPCGRLVNSASEPILLDGVPLKVSGVTQDVVLPNGFNAFALAPGATASNTKIDIDANDALFHIDPTSTLTINGTKVK